MVTCLFIQCYPLPFIQYSMVHFHTLSDTILQHAVPIIFNCTSYIHYSIWCYTPTVHTSLQRFPVSCSLVFQGLPIPQYFGDFTSFNTYNICSNNLWIQNTTVAKVCCTLSVFKSSNKSALCTETLPELHERRQSSKWNQETVCSSPSLQRDRRTEDQTITFTFRPN